MATAQLTERQQEIKALMDKGKTPPEIAKLLKITDNAVYQQLRRMKGRNGAPKRTAKRKVASRGVRATLKAATSPPPPGLPAIAAPMTPLAAIRERLSVLGAELRESSKAVAETERTFLRANEAHGKLAKRHQAEQAVLAEAEALLSKPKTPRKPRTKPGAKRAAKPASPNGAAAAQTAEPPAVASNAVS